MESLDGPEADGLGDGVQSAVSVYKAPCGRSDSHRFHIAARGDSDVCPEYSGEVANTDPDVVSKCFVGEVLGQVVRNPPYRQLISFRLPLTKTSIGPAISRSSTSSKAAIATRCEFIQLL
jgi:hypothetical protein